MVYLSFTNAELLKVWSHCENMADLCRYWKKENEDHCSFCCCFCSVVVIIVVFIDNVLADSASKTTPTQQDRLVWYLYSALLTFDWLKCAYGGSV